MSKAIYKPKGKVREMATWEYECYIDGLDGLYKWYVHEFELGEDGS